MSRTLLVVAALAALPVVSRPEQPPRAEGTIEAGEARVEMLGKHWAAGDTVELPEGYLRVEEDADDDGAAGSFTVVPAGAIASVDAAAVRRAAVDAAGSGTIVVAAEEPPQAAPRPSPDCSAERRAYLAEIWKQSGIQLSDPEGFIAGLEQTSEGSDLTLAWFALSTDAFRTLAWSSDARAKAAALARCAQGR